MIRSSALARTARRGVWLAGVAALAFAGLVSAQPAAPSNPPLIAVPPPQQPAQPIQEEAPPQETPTPAPVVVPPMTEKEIAPAPPEAAAEPEKPAAPPRRARYDVAVLEAVDKITAETLVFEAPVGKPLRYKGLIFTVRACERSSPEEAVEDSVAYLSIDSQPRAEAGRPTPPARQVFKGWMYASSPGLHPLEHPVYDAWVISCRAAAPQPAPGPVASR
ncbi:MAG TPA: DUF2155 domain-containing protein [Phenylobacterium sp.]|uniref:DUF2155 domain-containing protein n=1 Tax=Phenylobacterium sp. TaxID=1871053 RepID=UPI002B498060|nr:DUF2155 domain-containing protein [Phenylobacterium sp.]HKR90087.1 DUF2155 domain-containing protein [Phenylobacterium sp.]